MYSVDGAPAAAAKKCNKKLVQLLAENSTDDEMDALSMSATPLPDSDTHKPWLHEFQQYLDRIDEVPNGMTITKWWGVHWSRPRCPELVAGSREHVEVVVMVYQCTGSVYGRSHGHGRVTLSQCFFVNMLH